MAHGFFHVRHAVSTVPGARKAWAATKKIAANIRYAREFRRFTELSKAAGCPPPTRTDRIPCLGDSGCLSFDRHYVYHTAWAARVLARTRPKRHVDISSSLYFVGIGSAFVPIEHYDYRPPDIKLDNLESGFADLLNLPFPDRSIASLSCMHVVEHVGLGRYGDPLNPEGDVKAAQELWRVLAPEGQLLFVVPVGRPRICFNAHRIYDFDRIIQMFADLSLAEFQLLPDDPADAGLQPTPEAVHSQDYGCGCFLFKKPT